MEREFDVTTPDGTMPCFAAWPDADGPHPVIVMYMDAPGIREELYNFARRIAAQGYYAILPDLYYRLGTHRFNLSNRTEKMTEMIFAAWHSLANADVVSDTGALLEALGEDDAASDGPMGCVGYCMSGAFITAVPAPSRIALRPMFRFTASGSSRTRKTLRICSRRRSRARCTTRSPNMTAGSPTG